MPQSPVLHRWMRVLGAVALVLALAVVGLPEAQAQEQKPNILVIMGDDIGQSNISAYTGMMGSKRPTSTASPTKARCSPTTRPAELHGRALGVHHRPGPVPHRPDQGGPARGTVGLQKEDPTIAELLKPLGYATGQFGKNHLGDRDEYLPTNHGFDEFFGNLYHLNAEEEPEHPDYPKDPGFRKGSARAASSSRAPMAKSMTPAR